MRKDDVMQLLDFFDNREEIGHIDILNKWNIN